MRRNIEIKARVSSTASIVERVRSISDEDPVVIDQEDTFFHAPRGRLKLRKFSNSHGELIYYDRPDSRQPVASRYTIHESPDPDSLRDTLSRSLGVRGVVRKRRVLYLVGQSRIHLDEVEGLGDFVEIEVVLDSNQSDEDGAGIAMDLMSRLGIDEGSLVDGAYVDLLLEGNE